jgi:hypothetical protein
VFEARAADQMSWHVVSYDLKLRELGVRGAYHVRSCEVV